AHARKADRVGDRRCPEKRMTVRDFASKNSCPPTGVSCKPSAYKHLPGWVLEQERADRRHELPSECQLDSSASVYMPAWSPRSTAGCSSDGSLPLSLRLATQNPSYVGSSVTLDRSSTSQPRVGTD